MKNKNKTILDEVLFYRTMKESFVAITTSSFNNLLKESVKQFKEGVSQNQNLLPPAVAGQGTAALQAKGAEKITFIKEHFRWESTDVGKLACHLLSKFSIQFLFHDGFIQRLDNRLIETEKSTVNETLLCQVMKESFSSSTEAIFNSLLKMHVPRSPNEDFL